MTNESYDLLVDIANDKATEGEVSINGIKIKAGDKDNAKIALALIDTYNLMGRKKANENQYGQGNDCAMPKGCWDADSYLDGIHQKFSDEYSAGWSTVQPTFKLDMSANNWNGQVEEVSAKLANPNYPAAASGYNQAEAIMPASAAFPDYLASGRGQSEAQVGYVSGQDILVPKNVPANLGPQFSPIVVDEETTGE